MSERLSRLLSAAMVECEKEMARSMDGRAEGVPLPRKWFAYNELRRKIKPTYHAAEQEARRTMRRLNARDVTKAGKA